MFQKMRTALATFMYGRNGADQLSMAMLWAAIILNLLSLLLVRSALIGTVLRLLVDVLLIWSLFRIFSKNLYRRREENTRFLRFVWDVKNRASAAKARRQDKDHKYFTCKGCKTICRVPAGKGKIIITCPKCGRQIQGKS